VIATGAGSTITVLGVHAADLGAANFEFNVEPVTINTGTMTIGRWRDPAARRRDREQRHDRAWARPAARRTSRSWSKA
jgi:hypothetical protein